jgi:O6-methylguanine-DNA--protein-cysteine methyltransferase
MSPDRRAVGARAALARRAAARAALVRGVALLLLAGLVGAVGCGLREAQTGSLHGRLFDAAGNVVVGAQVYSIHREYEKVFSGDDGVFYLSELPAGRNRLVITHPKFRLEEREVMITANEVTRLEAIRLSQGAAPQFISPVRVETVGSSTATLTWKTYRPLLCQVEYGTTMGYGQTATEREAAEDHRLTLTGLLPETVYHARIRFTDESSITWYSYDLPFKTATGDGPFPPPIARLQSLPAYGVIVVGWDLSTSTSAVGYDVWRRTDDGPWELMTTDRLDRTTREFRDATAQGGRFYQYGVTAVDGFGAASAKTVTAPVFMPGVLLQDLRLTASASPYVLVSDLIVGAGVTLFVEPGVEIRVASGDVFRLGEDPDKVEILVQGRMVMTGTVDRPIRFTALDGASSRAHWGGIRLRAGGTGASELAWVELFGGAPWAVDVDGVEANLHDLAVRYAEAGVRYANTRNPPPLVDCRFDDIASAAISVRGCRRFHIERCTVTAAAIGLWHEAVAAEDRLTMRETHLFALRQGVAGRFSRSVFANDLVVCPEGVGFDFLTATGQENAVDHCTIDAQIGIRIASGAPQIENNLIVNLREQGTYGIQVTGPNALTFQFNNVYGFGRAYEGCNPGTGAAAWPPAFVGGSPFDWHLETASPLKRADRYGLEIGRYGKSFL